MGKPALHRRAVAASAAIMILGIYPACRVFGVVGGQVAALAAIATSYLLQISRVRSLTGLSLSRYGRAFLPAGIASVVFLCAAVAIRYLGLAQGSTAQMVLVFGAFLLSYSISVPAMLRMKGDSLSWQ